MELHLEDKVALVTGASRGLGLAIGRRLAEEGCAIALCAREADALERAAAELGRTAPAVHWGAVDVTEPHRLAAFVADAANALGAVDLLVANAGGSVGAGLADSTADAWSATFALNAVHAASALRACVPHMQARGGGSAVFIASISAWKPAPRAQYAAAKAAVVAAAASLAHELAPERIRVNAVSPGSLLFEGGGWDRFRARHPARFEAWRRDAFPLGRLGTPEEVADVVCFLLSERASLITGSEVRVDGAQTIPSAYGY